MNSLLSGLNYTHAVAGGCVSALAALVDVTVKLLLATLFGARCLGTQEEFVVRSVAVFATMAAALTALAPTTGVDLIATVYLRVMGICVFGAGTSLQNVVVVTSLY